MKPLPAIAACMVAVFLALSPVMALAVTYSVTVSTNASNYKSGDSVLITGAVSPAPGSGTAATIKVTNPSGTTVALDTASVDGATGAYKSTAFTAGGSSAWVGGIYTVTVTWALDPTSTPVTATTTFTFTGPTAATGTLYPYLVVSAVANSPVWPGQKETLAVLVQWNNGSLACDTPCFTTVHFYTPAGKLVTVFNPADSSTNPTTVHRGFFIWSWTVPSDAPDGLYAIHAWASLTSGGNKYQGQGLGSYTVNSAIASQASVNSVSQKVSGVGANVSAIAGQVSALKGSVDSISTTIGSMLTTLGKLQTIQTSVSSLSDSVSALGAKVDGLSSSLSSVQQGVSNVQSGIQSIQGSIGSLSGLSNQITDLKNAVSSNQTYVLVVAALAAITLVLELAILVRKLS